MNSKWAAFRVTHGVIGLATRLTIEIDAVAEFEILGGAIIKALVECKYYK